MADSMDLVQQRVEEERQRHIHTARNKAPGVSRVLCIDCDAPIPPAPAVLFLVCSAASPVRKSQS
ncbi:TPA: conjugal transfer protein TraR [Klebsiella pneumoniae]|nr:conjugal transfer protein TraR [Klebsiella pneumoniae]